MMRLFEYEARVPSANPLTPCDFCGRSWGALCSPADWCCDCAVPEVFLMADENRTGKVGCARCWHERMAAVGMDWANEINWLTSLWEYLRMLGKER